MEHENVPVWKPFSTKAVANHAHLYTQIATGTETDEIEKWFDREFESPAEEAIAKATSDRRLSHEDWKRLIRFLALQDIRTPAWFTQQMKRLDETLPQLMKATMENSIQRIQEAAETGTIIEPLKLPAAEREGLPLRVSVGLSPSGGDEIGAEMLRGENFGIGRLREP